MSSTEDIQRERKKSREHDEEMATLQAAFNANDGMDPSFVEQILSSDDVKAGDASDLQEVTIAKIQSLMGRDPLLANYTKAQEHDIRFKLEVLKYKILGVHPPDDSAVTGATRAFLYDDEMEELQPLSQQERILIDEFIETVKTRATRGREGFERQQLNTKIAESRSQNQSESDNGSLSIFS